MKIHWLSQTIVSIMWVSSLHILEVLLKDLDLFMSNFLRRSSCLIKRKEKISEICNKIIIIIINQFGL